MRLQKFLAHSGIASRRKSEEIIALGRVKVNNSIITDPAFNVDRNDKVEVDGKIIRNKSKFEYYILNKPIGVVSTASDEKERVNVTDIIDTKNRIYPVGRLDIDTAGLIILTNDGELTNIMTHPKYEIKKTYIATVTGRPNKKSLDLLRGGMTIDGYKTKGAKVKILKNYETHSVIEITIDEGRNRQIKKMFEQINHPVKSLKRISIGDLQIGGLTPGNYREFNEEELQYVEKLKRVNR